MTIYHVILADEYPLEAWISNFSACTGEAEDPDSKNLHTLHTARWHTAMKKKYLFLKLTLHPHLSA